jgi:signal transduction histidine kinase
VARRLCRQWSLPAWASDTIGRLELPSTGAACLGGDASLLAIVRLAVHLAADVGEGANLLGRDEAALEDAALLGVNLCALRPDELLADEPLDVPAWRCPYDAPLLRDVLSLAAENRHLRGGPPYFRLEREVDDLQAALRDQMRGEADRLRQAKLAALAEFAAGAGHEINNPLAVISGQAQYVLGHGDEWLAGDEEGAARKALNTIIGQTKRVHAILRDLMLFARPAPARPDWFDLPALLGEVAASFAELAGAKHVRTTLSTPDRLAVWADAEQLRQALGCLVRNAVEAAPAQGWVKLTAEAPPGSDAVEVWVEDSGAGPAPEQRPHLFDPFFSGRNAGRGKGLGLPVAWRLARQQGGDVRLEAPRPGQPTRFVLTLPLVTSPDRLRAA